MASIPASPSIGAMGALANESKPWFLSVGFVRPHLPFNCPEQFWRETPTWHQNEAQPRDARNLSLLIQMMAQQGWGRLLVMNGTKRETGGRAESEGGSGGGRGFIARPL